jgi:DNA-binding response OmpR family regulator
MTDSMVAPVTILIAEDLAPMRLAAQHFLEQEGYAVIAVEDGLAAIEAVSQNKVDLLLLDVALPGASGFEVCRRVRKTSSAAVLFWSSSSQPSSILEGFDAGGDDYISKSRRFSLVASRISTLLQWAGLDGVDPLFASTVRVGDLLLEDIVHALYVRAERVQLSPLEYHLLRCFLQNPNMAVDRLALPEKSFESHLPAQLDLVGCVVKRLREKIESNPELPVWLVTVDGRKYMMVGSVEQ